MELLVLGGTAFLSRTVASIARDRGHQVTCLARGTAAPPQRVRFLSADRDIADSLSVLAGEHFDAVVDVSVHPGQVRRAAAALPNCHWVYVSSTNVYARFDRPEQSESSELLAPLKQDSMRRADDYGPAKVACEQAVLDGVTSAAIVRCGIVTGPGDLSGRGSYYPWRFAYPSGPDVIAPDDPEFPVSMIDVADLAAWLVTVAEQRITGIFNATGLTTNLGAVLELSRVAAGPQSVPVRWVPTEVLADVGVQGWSGPTSLPLWLEDPHWRWFTTLDTSLARAHGLATRPLDETLVRTLDWQRRVGPPQGTGLSDYEEAWLRDLLAE